MEIELSEIVLCEFVLRPLLFPLRRGRKRALSSECKLGKRILCVECPFYYPISYRKSVPIHKPSDQIPNAFNEHDIAGKTINYLVKNALIQQNDFLVSGC